MAWLQTLPTTNARIATTLVVVLATGGRYLWAGIPPGGESVWNSWLLFVAIMAGIDASQYIGKRFSDTAYAAATKAAPVSINAASSPASVLVSAATPTPATPDTGPTPPALAGEDGGERGEDDAATGAATFRTDVGPSGVVRSFLSSGDATPANTGAATWMYDREHRARHVRDVHPTGEKDT